MNTEIGNNSPDTTVASSPTGVLNDLTDGLRAIVGELGYPLAMMGAPQRENIVVLFQAAPSVAKLVELTADPDTLVGVAAGNTYEGSAVSERSAARRAMRALLWGNLEETDVTDGDNALSEEPIGDNKPVTACATLVMLPSGEAYLIGVGARAPQEVVDFACKDHLAAVIRRRLASFIGR